MEGVLDTYQREFAADEVPVCMDETSRQQTREIRKARKARSGRPAIVDCEYERNGTANLLMAFAPLEGWHRITDRETMCWESKAWVNRRNEQAAKVGWRFRTEEARIKLKSLYPDSNDHGENINSNGVRY
ncbi:MAG: hypothetical protein OXI87_12890 [Albidovulum sp.]|nr:hypothetical protein [Albidovulum sp.]